MELMEAAAGRETLCHSSKMKVSEWKKRKRLSDIEKSCVCYVQVE